MYHIEIGYKDERWMELTQDHVRLWTLVLVVLSCRVLLPYDIGEVLSTLDAVCCRKL